MNLDPIFILIVKSIFYLAASLLGLLGIFSVYILVRYGRTSLITLSGSALYIIVFLSIVLGSLGLLAKL